MRRGEFSLLLFPLIFWFTPSTWAQTPEIKWWFDMNDAAYGSAACADIDKDGKVEIVFGCYRRDSSVYALNGEDGSLLWKRNLAELPNQGCNDVAPIISDVDLDGDLEVIVPASCNPRTFCLDGASGEVEWVTFVHGSDSPPTIADIDEDGKPEILHGGFAGYITCLNGEDGSIVWDERIEPGGSVNGEPIILDADNDGDLDVITSSWNFSGPSKIKCFQAKDLTELWTYAEDLEHMYHGPSFADIDGDSLQELVISHAGGDLLVINAEDGSLHWDFKFDLPFHNAIYATTLADLNDDQNYEIIYFDYGTLGVLDAEGDLLWSKDLGFDEIFRGASVSDVTNDDRLDIVFAGDELLYALDGETGDEHWSIDLAAHDGRDRFRLDHGVLIADFDLDDTLDVFVAGGYGVSSPTIDENFGRAYCVSTGSTGGPDWRMFRRDSVRSGAVPIEDMQTSLNPVMEPVFTIYPNPATQVVFIEFSDIPGFPEINVLDLHSRTVIRSRERQVDVSSLSQGIYFIQISAGTERHVQKLVVHLE